jgi:hypothetical protein
MHTRPLTVVWLASLLVPLCVAAQENGTSPGAASTRAGESRACFRPAPRPRCDVFWTTEFSLGRMITSPREVVDTFPGYSYSEEDGTIVVVPPEEYRSTPPTPFVVSWELGLMRNLGVARAVGGSLFAAIPMTTAERTQLGVRVRHRWWALGGATVDLSPGVYVARDVERVADLGEAKRRLGVSVRGAVATPSDLVGLVAELDTTPGHVGLQLSGRLGSVPGAIAGVAVPTGFLALWFLYSED